MRKILFCLFLASACSVFSVQLYATIFGKIQGIVHDPQHRPIAGATVKLQAITSDWTQTTKQIDNGEFSFTSVPVGDYKITVTPSNLKPQNKPLPSLPAPLQFFTFS